MQILWLFIEIKSIISFLSTIWR